MDKLENQVAIISGGAGDIGRAIALELARQGAGVAIGDVRGPEAGAPLLEQVQAMGQKGRYDYVDVSDAESVGEWLRRVETDLGVPTLIIPNAAIVTLKGISIISADEWDQELQVNLNGAFYLAQAAAQRLLYHQQPGRIVFIGSWAAHTVHTRLPAYCVAKAGLRMLCRCMALELAPFGITVNEVAPGYVDAGLSGRIFDENPGQREKAAKTVPNGALIEPIEVARQVAHLCDPDNRHMTGSVLLMDGGLSLISPGGARDD